MVVAGVQGVGLRLERFVVAAVAGYLLRAITARLRLVAAQAATAALLSVQVAVAAVLVDETSAVAVQAIQEALAAMDKTLLTAAAAAVAE